MRVLRVLAVIVVAYLCMVAVVYLMQFAGCNINVYDLANPPAAPVQADPQPEASAESAANEYTAKVVGIIDGDTIDVLTADNTTTRIGLAGIDAPERGQPFSNNAKDFLGDLVHGRDVRIVATDTDRYGRTIAEVYVDDQRVTLYLVGAGLAWHYKKYSDDIALDEAEIHAREAGKGLWADSRYVPPWEWRGLSKDERDKLR